jgi:hypothetical protein
MWFTNLAIYCGTGTLNIVEKPIAGIDAPNCICKRQRDFNRTCYAGPFCERWTWCRQDVNVRFWHLADIPELPINVRFRV